MLRDPLHNRGADGLCEACGEPFPCPTGIAIFEAVKRELEPPTPPQARVTTLVNSVVGLALIVLGVLGTMLQDATPVYSPGPPAAQSLAVQPRVKVVVAKATLPAQTVLSVDNVELRDASPDAVQPNVETTLADVEGKTLAVPVAVGQQILTLSLVIPAKSPTAMSPDPTATALPQNLAIVAVDVANVRSSPSIAASVLEQVKYGTELQIIGQSADWFKVKLPDQSEGWIARGWIVTPG